jgi:hypothetical protein
MHNNEYFRRGVGPNGTAHNGTYLVNHLAHYAGESLVFPSPGGRLINPSNWRRRIWQPAVTAAALEAVTFHALRHSSASLLVAEGVNAKVIQTRLGHSDVRTTLQVYGHLYEGFYLAPSGLGTWIIPGYRESLFEIIGSDDFAKLYTKVTFAVPDIKYELVAAGEGVQEDMQMWGAVGLELGYM